MKLELTMNKQRARQLYELADRLSKLDVNTLSEEQLQQRNTMIAKLQEEVKEGVVDADKEPGEYDQEGDMAKQDLATAANAAEELRSILDSDENLPEWVQSKITKAVDYLDTVRDYMKSKDQDVTEGSQRVDSLVTDALRIMKGAEVSDAVSALKTVLGDREYNGRRGHYNFYVRQILDMYNQQGSLKEFAPGNGGGESGRWYTDDQMTDLVGDGWWNDLDVSGDIPKQQMIQEAQAWLDDQGYSVQVLNCKVNDDDMEWFIEGSFQNSRFAKKGVAEAKKPSPKLTPVNMKKTDPVSEEINTEAYERLQKVFAFKNYES